MFLDAGEFVLRESMSGLPDAEEWKAIGVAAEAKKKSREQGHNVTWNDVYMELMRVCEQQLSGVRMHARKIRETITLPHAVPDQFLP